MRHLGWTRLIGRVAEHLRTDIARARVRAECEAIDDIIERGLLDEVEPALLERLPALRPETEASAACARQDELLGIEALLLADDDDGPRIEAALGQLEDLDDSLAAARAGSLLSVVELIGVAELCRACGRVAAAFEQASHRQAAPGRASVDADWLRGLRACAARLLEVGDGDGDGTLTLEQPVAIAPQLLAMLDRAIDRSGDEPCISSDASPELKEARTRLRGAKQALQSKAEHMVRQPTIAECLRDRYWTDRDGRIVLPVRSDRLGPLRSGGAIIHGSSATGQTFYVEPAELVEHNNALREAELAVAEAELAIRRELTAAVAERAAGLQGMQRACVEIDLMIARLRFGESIGARLPMRFDELATEQPEIDLRAARHPMMLLDGIDVVPNDIVLGRGHALVISGPNAGGKTVALKTLGVLALMAAAGFALPCSGRPRVPLFVHLITDVGDDQSITANLSTFSAHIAHVRDALAAAGPDTLVLLDEVAVGTDPDQGAALAEAILVGLVEAGATVVVTTHYDRLKLLATAPATAAQFHNAAVGFDLTHMRPTFRLSLGVPGSSSAIAVARRLGLPEPILARAEQLLGDEGVEIDQLLREIEAERQSLARTRERLEREASHLRQRDSEVRLRERRVLEGVRSRRAKAYTAAAEQLRALELELKHKRKHLRQIDPMGIDALPTRAELAGEARTALAAHRAETEAELEAERAVDERIDPSQLAVGDRVHIPAMKQGGEVVALIGSPPKKATVQLPSLRTTVKLSELTKPPPTPAQKRIRAGKAAPIFDFNATIRAQAQAHFGDAPTPVKAGFDNTCDVRGLRFEDAQTRVEQFIADALARDQDVIVIRHGHGGGTLRKAVREVLSRSANVRAQRSGLTGEGGEAVTIVWIE